MFFSISCIFANTPRCAISEGTRRACSHSCRVRRDTPSFAADSSRVHPRCVRQFNKRMANSSFLERAPLISLLGAFIAVASTAGQGAFRAVGISEPEPDRARGYRVDVLPFSELLNPEFRPF